MKILKNNTSQNSAYVEEVKKIAPYPRKLICEHCSSELEYEESDLRIGALGAIYLVCPCCGRDNMLEENENSITLTMNNIEFPTHFFHTSKETGAVDCCNNTEVKKYIQHGIEYLRSYKEEQNWFAHIGNLYINISRWEDDEDYWIVVSNNFYDTYISFESKDY